jgi:LysM domain
MRDPSSSSSPLRRPGFAAAVGVAVFAVACVGACLPGGTRGTGEPRGSDLGVGATPSPSIAVESAAPSGPTPSPSIVRPTPTPAPTFLIYTVARGDSLNMIAHRFGTTARSIAYWNRTTYPSLDPESSAYRPGLLQVGWTLQVIPNVTFDEDSLAEPSDGIVNGSDPPQ